MRLPAPLPICALLLVLALPLAAQAGSRTGGWQEASVSVPDDFQAPDAAQPTYLDKELVREHERFAQFARDQVERMNATILGGRSSMQVRRGADGMFHASYKAIDAAGVICQVSRASSDPRYYVGNLIYKEQVLVSVARSPEACRQGPFEPVSEKANRVIYTSKPGGGWQ